ncbi:MAG: transporter substrate-binding domain-containing protein, partial [Coriobacteriia bacterium]|nr:transporter substrate-binding domain-containing protein [Coriobacteriia bacterium]
LVDVKQSEMAEALNKGTIDIMLGATPITDTVLADVSSAGSYLIDGPGIFTVVAEDSVPTTLTIDDLPGKRVITQKESYAYWELGFEFGDDFAQSTASLVEAFDALVAGNADVLVGDAAVCAYVGRDYPTVAFVGQFGSAQPLGVAVKKDAVELEAAVREALDSLAADGTLDTIRRKWLGDLPLLVVPAEEP